MSIRNSSNLLHLYGTWNMPGLFMWSVLHVILWCHLHVMCNPLWFSQTQRYVDKYPKHLYSEDCFGHRSRNVIMFLSFARNMYISYCATVSFLSLTLCEYLLFYLFVIPLTDHMNLWWTTPCLFWYHWDVFCSTDNTCASRFHTNSTLTS